MDELHILLLDYCKIIFKKCTLYFDLQVHCRFLRCLVFFNATKKYKQMESMRVQQTSPPSDANIFRRQFKVTFSEPGINRRQLKQKTSAWYLQDGCPQCRSVVKIVLVVSSEKIVSITDLCVLLRIDTLMNHINYNIYM